jgi:hypothetical protein
MVEIFFSVQEQLVTFMAFSTLLDTLTNLSAGLKNVLKAEFLNWFLCTEISKNNKHVYKC